MANLEFSSQTMEIKRTTEVVVKTSRRFVIRQADTVEQAVCVECTGFMVTAEQTAAICGISRRTVYQLIENGAVHFAETPIGVLLVCPNSLAAILEIGNAKQLPESVAGQLSAEESDVFQFVEMEQQNEQN